jgi:hypothetical protein
MHPVRFVAVEAIIDASKGLQPPRLSLLTLPAPRWLPWFVGRGREQPQGPESRADR